MQECRTGFKQPHRVAVKEHSADSHGVGISNTDNALDGASLRPLESCS